jgi:regulatory protein
MSTNKKSAMEAASAYLANRMRTVEEVRRRLRDKEYDAAEIEETINDLIGLRYLDDYLYAMRYYEYNREKRRGSGRAARELAEKGVDEATIRNAREDFLFENNVNEFEDALAVAVKAAEDRELDEKLRAKIARKLETAGFSKGDIIRVLGELNGRQILQDD